MFKVLTVLQKKRKRKSQWYIGIRSKRCKEMQRMPSCLSSPLWKGHMFANTATLGSHCHNVHLFLSCDEHHIHAVFKSTTHKWSCSGFERTVMMLAICQGHLNNFTRSSRAFTVPFLTASEETFSTATEVEAQWWFTLSDYVSND